MHYSDAVEST